MDNTKILERFLPQGIAPVVATWIEETRCEFTISKSRQSKLGDYRAPYQGKPHQISVNHNLNRFAFLITTVHEFAHLYTWQQHKGRVNPHGMEWKTNFKRLMQPFFQQKVFPEDVHHSLIKYMNNPAASSCSDTTLQIALNRYNPSPSLTVGEIPVGSTFELPNGRKFQLLSPLRKRFKCQDIESKKMYLISPIAEVLRLL